MQGRIATVAYVTITREERTMSLREPGVRPTDEASTTDTSACAPTAKSRWSVIAAYAAMAAASQAILVNYAPVTGDAAHHFGVSITAIGWLSQVFPLLYVIVAIPAGLALDRYFRPALVAGAVLTVAGSFLRLVADDYSWALTGQLVAAVGQPFILNAVTGLAVVYLVAKDRTTGIAIASSAVFAGMVAGNLLGALLPGEEHIRTLTVITAVIAMAAGLCLLVALRFVRTLAGTNAIPATNGLRSLRAAFGNRHLRRLCAVVAIPMGAFMALTTYAQPMLEPAGVSETSAGLILAGMMVAGVVASAVVPVWADRHRREVRFMGVSIVLTAGACLLLAWAPSTAMAYVMLIGVGLVLLPALPIVLALTERHAPEAEGTAAGLIWLSGNLGGVVLATIIGVLVTHASTAFVTLAALILLAAPALCRYRGVERPSGADAA
ncbi:MFS transporter [Flexivirga oryzae]|uniref:Putative MFS family arabinose efflux permease n=1 Tax=Flexivirga oryzae TaxID=1794944 RepID=A0A839N8A8_9MICO|nr:MFS transporter [Flexivirga oryzae]MBB2890981.1 putative MFS family arabinose efflux permease [Flexivirga oryzae]